MPGNSFSVSALSMPLCTDARLYDCVNEFPRIFADAQRSCTYCDKHEEWMLPGLHGCVPLRVTELSAGMGMGKWVACGCCWMKMRVRASIKNVHLHHV